VDGKHPHRRFGVQVSSGFHSVPVHPLEIDQTQGSAKSFLKKHNPLFLGAIGFSALPVLVFWIFFYLNEQLGRMFNVGYLAHQVSFYLDSPLYPRSSKSSQIHYLLVVRSCKHEEICNYYWQDKLKLN